MTRFARYSSSGIKKPPCEATPWSELVPPGTTGASQLSPEAKDPGVPSASNFKSEAEQYVKKKKKHGKICRLSKQLANMDVGNDGSEKLKLKGKKLKAKKSADKEEAKKLKKALKSMTIGVVSGKAGKKSKKLPKNVNAAEEDLLSHLYPIVTDNVNGSTLLKEKKKKLKKQKKRSLDSEDFPEADLINAEDDASNWSLLACPPTPAVQNTAATTDDMVPKPGPGEPYPEEDTTSSSFPPKEKIRHKMKHSSTAGTREAGGDPVLAESKLMTMFDGYWVRRRSVPRLEKVRAELTATISDPQMLQREMKKRKRAEHRLLLSALAARGAWGDSPGISGAVPAFSSDTGKKSKKKKSKNIFTVQTGDIDANGIGHEVEMKETSAVAAAGNKPAVDEESDSDGEPKLFQPVRGATSQRDGDAEERMVRFDGVWMTGEAVGRLKELRRKLKQQRVSQMVLKQTMKTARRREEMKRKRDVKKVCLGCRKLGHMVAECPQRRDSARAPITGLCFRCGSTEHRLQDCRRKPAADAALPYAVCFVCGKTGHLSKECSLNPNGVYPKGGACKVCHQRSHLADDCPERKEEETAATGPRLAVIGVGAGVEEDYEHDFKDLKDEASETTSGAVNSGPKPRLVKF